MRKIIIVEDEEEIRELLKLRLEKMGFECFLAEDGLRAVTLVKDKRPDLVVLDLMLPKLSGEEVCKEIRKDPEVGNTPIIMLTGKDSDVDRVVGKVIGANCYMSKPCDVHKLLDVINNLLGKREDDKSAQSFF